MLSDDNTYHICPILQPASVFTQTRSGRHLMSAELSLFLQKAQHVLERLEPLLPKKHGTPDWSQVLAARWQPDAQGGYLAPLSVNLALELEDLLGIERQRSILTANTQQFIQGFPANHALLWGARGTGKSSLVRALLARFAVQGLRLIEIERDALTDLPRLVASLGQDNARWRFIVFCDDLSFEAGEGDYRVLKSVLDGSLEQAPDNLLLYATSNRRHLVPEKSSDNDHWQMVEGELHPNEAVEDKIALSDRFGLWLSFYSFSQDQYLDAVRHWVNQLAKASSLNWIWNDSDEKEALRWALGRGNRSGRCAYQFARHWVGVKLSEQKGV